MNNSNALNVLTTIPTTTFIAASTQSAVDKGIQCNLLSSPVYAELSSFSIEDKNSRRFLVRFIYGWIILQNCFYLPVMYLLLQCERIIPEDYFFEVVRGLLAINLIWSALSYYFRAVRRALPYLSLIFVTMLSAVIIGFFANAVNELAILMQPTTVIVQLLAVILFSFQTKWELTYAIAFLIIFLIFISLTLFNVFILSQNGEFYIAYALGTLTAVYVTFDVQLMLTSPLHAYCMTANEHVFGAVNVFADQSKLGWLMFRCFFLDGILTVLKTILKTLKSKLY